MNRCDLQPTWSLIHHETTKKTAGSIRPILRLYFAAHGDLWLGLSIAQKDPDDADEMELDRRPHGARVRTQCGSRGNRSQPPKRGHNPNENGSGPRICELLVEFHEKLGRILQSDGQDEGDRRRARMWRSSETQCKFLVAKYWIFETIYFVNSRVQRLLKHFRQKETATKTLHCGVRISWPFAYRRVHTINPHL